MFSCNEQSIEKVQKTTRVIKKVLKFKLCQLPKTRTFINNEIFMPIKYVLTIAASCGNSFG